MEVLHGLESLPGDQARAAVTVGFFDGVHRGHQAVFNRTVEAARERGATPMVVTFDRHPREILTPANQPQLLTTLQHKAELMAALDLEVAVVLGFDEEFSRWPAEEFVRRILVDGVHAEHVVVGSNFTFGYRAIGTLPLLVDLGATHGFTVEGVALLRLGGRPVSSSSIRQALAEGDLEWPREALGRRYSLAGTVVRGAGRGVDLGYPTANLFVPPRMLIPADGVYAGTATVRGERHVAAINVGTNPTFGNEPRHVEAFLLDFEDDVRDERMVVEFWERLRDEQRFASPDDLARQIKDDVERTRAVVKE